MPTYHYKCKSCAHEFDQFQKFSEDPLAFCPECGESIRRVIQPVGVVFKGSGWYINDSRPAAKSDSDATADKTESKKSDEKAAPTTESKTEAAGAKTAAPA